MKKTKSNGENPHPTTNGKKAAKKQWKDTYYNYRSWRQKVVDEDYLVEVGKKFVDFCYEGRKKPKEKRLSLERFYEEEGIPESTMYDWRKQSNMLNQCIKFGKLLIGNRIEEGYITKDFSEKGCAHLLHHYHDKWLKIDSYHDERAKKRAADENENKMLQPLMLSADQFREAIKEAEETAEPKDKV